MPRPSLIEDDLINRYDKPGPLYTSYPPATEFHDQISESDYRDWARLSNEEPIPRLLSLYFHIPFCSSICYYCSSNKIVTRERERTEPYLQDLFREIEIQASLFDQDREVCQLHWGGGTPGFLSHRQAQQLMDKIARHFKLRDDARCDYSIEVDPRVMAKDGVAQLRNIGFNRVSIGVQDFDPQVQRAVNRIQSLKATSTIINDARRYGFRSVKVDLIYGLPNQTRQSFASTLATVINLDPDCIAIYSYAHLPHNFPSQRLINKQDLPDSREKFAILDSAIDKLCAAGYERIGMDHFARPGDALAIAQREGGLHRNFQGYSTNAQCDAVGLGISAISNVADHFSQNTTDPGAYHDILDNDQLPVVRGFHSEREDLLRREIIQQLACHLRLDLHRVAKRWDIDFTQHFESELRQLRKMEADGLVQLSESAITISESGRSLLRSICLVFDRYQQ